jgi:hypothetical protein
MRGNKGNLLEGGIRVPMFASWKGTILPGQVIDEMVTTLDFTATTLAAGGGDLPPEFDGVDILPRLTGQTPKIARTQPMFWDFYFAQAVRKGDWKLWRTASGEHLFNIATDPSELANLARQYPERTAELSKELDAWVSTLRPDAVAQLKEDSSWANALTGAPAGVKPDPRYRVPYDHPLPTPYPAPMTGVPVPHENGAVAPVVPAADGTPKRYDFNTDGDFEGWDGKVRYVENPAVVNGLLKGRAESGQGKFDNHSVNLDGSMLKRVVVRMKSGGTANALALRWRIVGNEPFNDVRKVDMSYKPGVWEEVVIDLAGNPAWEGQVISQIRIQPCNKGDTFEVDWIRFD